MSLEKQIDAILESIDNADYPEGFASKYTMLECLSQHDGEETFLVQNAGGGQFIAKCFDRSVWTVNHAEEILSQLSHEGLPKWAESFENDKITVTVREYIEGVSLDRCVEDNDLTQQQIVGICVKLCDILAYLHHRDINQQNIIVRENGGIALIDFDIARFYRDESETDTVFVGTRAYAPPEQYGFSQTDVRSDIYSLGVLLRWLLTGSTRVNKNIRVYKLLQKIIDKCTALEPKERYSDAAQVKKALLRANPRSQIIQKTFEAACVLLVAGLLGFGGFKLYQAITYSPFDHIGDAIPYMPDEERADEAVKYMKQKYDTKLFDDPDAPSTYGLLKQAMVECYRLSHDYAYASAGENAVMEESPDYFLAWPWDDSQMLFCDIAQYAAVKVLDPEIVKDWSSVKEIDGMYPGVTVAKDFCERNGILTGVNNPTTIFVKDLALILANADRVFEAAGK